MNKSYLNIYTFYPFCPCETLENCFQGLVNLGL